MGPVGLHGGGEFLPGDELFLDALLETAAVPAARRAIERVRAGEAAEPSVVGEPPTVAGQEPIRVVLLPTAAARGRPDLAAANGVAAFRRRAAVLGLTATVETAAVVDAATAEEPALVRRIAAADLVFLPGGDPDLVPAILADSAAGRALREAHRRGAVIAGASAGAMALTEWTWTPYGGVHGLGLIRGIAVVPHYDDIRRTSWQQVLDGLAPGGIGYLGLDERTGVIGNGTGAWRVAGEGSAHWFARGSTEPVVATNGALLPLPD